MMTTTTSSSISVKPLAIAISDLWQPELHGGIAAFVRAAVRAGVSVAVTEVRQGHADIDAFWTRELVVSAAAAAEGRYARPPLPRLVGERRRKLKRCRVSNNSNGASDAPVVEIRAEAAAGRRVAALDGDGAWIVLPNVQDVVCRYYAACASQAV